MSGVIYLRVFLSHSPYLCLCVCVAGGRFGLASQELLMFHGTTDQGVEGITQNGFLIGGKDVRVC